jgi:hypothetical protein
MKRPPKRIIEQEWMKQSMEQSIIASLLNRVSPDDLLDEQWLQFKDKLQNDDELWHFRTPMETWTEFVPRCGMEGYAIVRNDKVVDVIFTAMS